MIEELNNNIGIEIEMARQLASFSERLEYGSKSERRMFSNVIISLKKKIKLINNSVPSLLRNISLAKPLRTKKETGKDIKSIALKKESKVKAVVKTEDREEFLKQLNISEDLIKKLKKRKVLVEKKAPKFKRVSAYGKISNRFFLKYVEKLTEKRKYKSLSLDLKRSNLNILTSTYLSMMFFSIMLSVFLGLVVTIFLLFFSVGFSFPIVSVFEGSYLGRFLKVFWIALAFPLLTWTSFYFYPGAEKRSLGKRINQELPFVVVHMGSISGSGIEPVEIFKIIGLSQDYKYAGKEIRKVLNQTNIFGYDLITSLRNVARATPSTKLAELFNGLGVTINSGGDMQVFFEKRAESLLLEYRLEREKYTKVAETFMDIYISIVIATPMILLLLLVMISVSGIQIGLGINEMTLIIIGVVVLINIFFLIFLHIKQPGY